MQEPVTTFEVDGQAIWEARMRAGISVRELATAAGVSASYVRKIERGIRSHVSPSVYQRFRAAIGADEQALLASKRTPTQERK
jgi:transcriptional regulator with XRE-family HTH domain